MANYHNTNADSWKAKKRGFSGGGGRSGGSSYGGGRSGGNSYGGGGRSQTTMHEASCAQCNKSCQVPFRPNGRKPVYCSDCFRQEDHKASAPRYNDRGNERGRPARSESRGPSTSGLEKEIKSLNKKMDRIIRALEALGEGEGGEYEDEGGEEELLGDNTPGKIEDQINEDEGDVFTLE